MRILPIRNILLFSIDIFLAVTATLAAFVLRENLEFHLEHSPEIMPYVVITAGCASMVFLASGAGRAVWRYSSTPDYLARFKTNKFILLPSLASNVFGASSPMGA